MSPLLLQYSGKHGGTSELSCKGILEDLERNRSIGKNYRFTLGVLLILVEVAV